MKSKVENNNNDCNIPCDHELSEDFQFSQLTITHQENYLIDLIILEKVLSDPRLNIDIPNYINGRPTNLNSSLILATVWLTQKNFMEPQDIHQCLMAFESTANCQKTQHLPYNKKVLAKTLMSVNKIISNSMLIMWIKKCWKYMDFAQIISNSKSKKK